MTKKHWMVTWLMILTLLMSTGCGGSSTPEKSAGGGAGKSKDLKVALTATPPTLDLHRTTATVTMEVGWHIYKLVTFDSSTMWCRRWPKKRVSPDEKALPSHCAKGLSFITAKN